MSISKSKSRGTFLIKLRTTPGHVQASPMEASPCLAWLDGIVSVMYA